MPRGSIVLLARDDQRRRRKRCAQWEFPAMCCRNKENGRKAARRTGAGSGSWGTDTMVAGAPRGAPGAPYLLPRPHGKRGPLHRHRSRRRGLVCQRRSVLGGKYSTSPGKAIALRRVPIGEWRFDSPAGVARAYLPRRQVSQLESAFRSTLRNEPEHGQADAYHVSDAKRPR